MKIGVIDVGGGYRGIYAAGVLDCCMKNNLKFDFGIGISAGAANLISYSAGQYKRNFKFYSEYGLRKEYASISNFIKKKNFLDLDYIYSTLSNSDGENPFDYEAAMTNPMELYFLATDAITGRSKYFTKEEVPKDDYSILKASCAIPFVCQPQAVCGDVYFDGALADPVPVEKAFKMGCDKVVLILTRPENEIRQVGHDDFLAGRIIRKYPLAAGRMLTKAERYNEEVAIAKLYAKQGKVLIIAPDDTCGVGTIKGKKENLVRLYEKGLRDGEKITTFTNSDNDLRPL